MPDKMDEVLLIGSNIPQLAAEYYYEYQTVEELKAALKQATEMMEMKKQELIDDMDALSVKTIELYSGEVRITRSHRTFTKVTDYDGLCHYISDVLNEPLSAYGVFKFENKSLQPLVTKARTASLTRNIPLEDALPTGLELSITNIITVTTRVKE